MASGRTTAWIHRGTTTGSTGATGAPAGGGRLRGRGRCLRRLDLRGAVSSCGSSMTEVCAPGPPNMRGRAAVH